MRIQRSALIVLIALAAAPIGAAFVHRALFGLPAIVVAPEPAAAAGAGLAAATSGFPAWLRITHYVNLFFLILLVRSGLQILAEHARLYWNVHCTPNSEWLRLTPRAVPTDRLWTAKDDACHLSPWIGLPGHKHTVGIARHWHFLSVLFWLGNGAIFVFLLFGTGQWRRIVPTSWSVFPEAWAVFVHYATLHMPPEPNGFYAYNGLQKLAYFGVVFVLAPLAIATGPSMSPAFTNRFPWYPKLPGNRQIGRSLHFLVMCSFVAFTVIHVSMVCMTGFVRNMNHIVVGTDELAWRGVYWGAVGIAVVLAVNALANWLAWRHPRFIQYAARWTVTPVMNALFNRDAPVAEFPREEISPFFWPNGKSPRTDEWRAMFADGFKDYRLRVTGLVENPVELSLEEIKALGKRTQITLHHCIQGWSGIAEWGGLPVSRLIELVRPRPEATLAVFYSFGEGLEGGAYYDGHAIENLMHPQSILAYEMNGGPLGEQHGPPLRLRVENQLGFKMVKWIREIRFVASRHDFGLGEGGYNEDHEYFGELANI